MQQHDIVTGRDGFLVALTDAECDALMGARTALFYPGNGHPSVTVFAAASDEDALAVMEQYAARIDYADGDEPAM